jgi:hypothetical protein
MYHSKLIRKRGDKTLPTPREIEIGKAWLISDVKLRTIGYNLPVRVSEKTVEKHVQSLKDKLFPKNELDVLHDRCHLAKVMLRCGLLTIEEFLAVG